MIYQPIWTFKIPLLLLLLGIATKTGYSRSQELIQTTQELRICVAMIHEPLVKVRPAQCKRNCQYKGRVVEQVHLFADFLHWMGCSPRR